MVAAIEAYLPVGARLPGELVGTLSCCASIRLSARFPTNSAVRHESWQSLHVGLKTPPLTTGSFPSVGTSCWLFGADRLRQSTRRRLRVPQVSEVLVIHAEDG